MIARGFDLSESESTEESHLLRDVSIALVVLVLGFVVGWSVTRSMDAIASISRFEALPWLGLLGLVVGTATLVAMRKKSES